MANTDMRRKLAMMLDSYTVTASGVPPLSTYKRRLVSLKAFGGTEQRNLPAGYTQINYVNMLEGSYIRVEDLPISAGYKVEFDFQTTTLGAGLRNYLGGRALGVSAGGGFRLSKLASNNNDRVVLYGFEDGTEYYDPTTQFQANTRYKYTYDNGVCTLESGGSVISTNTFTITDNTSTNWGINDYCSNGAWSAYHENIYVYSVKVWDGQGELVMDLVPAKTSTEIGFYDAVTDEFRGPTSGTFAAGDDTVPTPTAPMDIVSNNGVVKAVHQSGLPLGYKLVDYIKSNAMIELDKPTNDTMEFVAKFYREDTNAQYLYQSDTSSNGTTNTTSYISSGGNWRFGRRTISVNVDTEVMITSVQNADGVWLNGEQVGTYENVIAFTSVNNLRLFGTQSSPTLRLYGMKVYQNGALFYDIVPCQRESDSAYGVYDLVSGQFFTNANATITAGSFISDPVVARGLGPIETVVNEGYYGNLVDLNALTSGYYYNASGVYTTANNVYLTDWIRVYNGDTITVYAKKTPAAYAPVIRINIFDAQKNWVSQPAMTLDIQDEDVTVLNITADGYIRISGSSNLIDWDAVQIIRGSYTVSTMPEYKAYVQYNIATCEDLFSIGDYTDVQSILDGVVTRNIGVLVLDGSENWSLGSVFILDNAVQRVAFPSTSMSTHFVGNENSIAPNMFRNNSFKVGATGYRNRIYIKATQYADETAFKAFLAQQYANGTPVIIVYPLETPTTETVAGQSMAFMKGLNTVEITQAGLDNLELEIKAR